MKKVLLTGASRGIGHSIKEELKNSPDLKIITPTRDELSLDCLNSISNYFSHEENCHIDILINNAGINIVKEIEDIKDDDIKQMMDINLISPLKLAQAVVPHMKKNNFGRIVNISSIWGERSIEKRVLYSSTKFGLIGQTKALARELGQYNILVNAVSPGFTETELTFRVLDEETRASLSESIPLKRFAKPNEIAKLVKFMISDENTYMTGQSVVIDGGFLA